MNKKMLFFGAALAALAAFTGCTSDDEIANTTTPKEPVTEEAVPFSVQVADDVTRADATTSENFSEFYLYNYQLGTPTLWGNDNEHNYGTYTLSGTTWTGPTANWPTSGGNSVFFATNVADNAPTVTGTNAISAFTVAAIPSSLAASYTFDPESSAGGGVIVRDAVTLTNVLNSADVKDIVYAVETNNGTGFTSAGNTEGANGSMKFTFNHALARINFNFKLNFFYLWAKGEQGAMDQEAEFWDDDLHGEGDFEPSTHDEIINAEFVVLIKSITLCNVQATGTFDLVAGEWNTGDKTQNIRIAFPEGNYLELKANSTTCSTAPYTITASATTQAGNMFIIPQIWGSNAFTTLTDMSTKTLSQSPLTTAPFIDIECIAYKCATRQTNPSAGSSSCDIVVGKYASVGDADLGTWGYRTAGFGHMYVPLNPGATSALRTDGLVAGKTYNWTFDLSKSLRLESGKLANAWGFANAGF